MTYTLTVTNNGPDAALGVSVVDQLPPSMAFVSVTPTKGRCGESGGRVTCALGSIADGATTTIDIIVKPTSAGTIVNIASVIASPTDPNGDNNADSESTPICRGSSRRSSVPCP